MYACAMTLVRVNPFMGCHVIVAKLTMDQNSRWLSLHGLSVSLTQQTFR